MASIIKKQKTYYKTCLLRSQPSTDLLFVNRTGKNQEEEDIMEHGAQINLLGGVCN